MGIDILSIQMNIILGWMPEDLIDGKSTLVQVMAWCSQATSHYLEQGWFKILMPYGTTRPQMTWMGHLLISKISYGK